MTVAYKDKFVFCQAPVGSGDVAALVALHGFLQSFVKGSVAFPPVEIETWQFFNYVDFGEKQVVA